MACSNCAPKKTYRYTPPLPVDRDWAWLIMVAGYVNMMVAVAFARSLSILLPEILERYQEPATVTTLAFGVSDLAWSLTNIALPTLLIPRFSIRSMALFGGFAHCMGVIALAYSTNIIVFNCIFGVLGFAGSFMVVLPLIHLGHYFKKRLSIASAIVHAGGSTATVIMPLLAQLLLDVYGYQGALLILAGLSFNSVAMAMLLRPISMYEDLKTTAELQVLSSVNGDPKPSLHDIQLQNESAIIDPDEELVNEESKFLDNEDKNNEQVKEVNLENDFEITKWTGIKNDILQNDGKEVSEETNFTQIFEGSLTKSASKNSVHNELEIMSLLPKASLLFSVNHHSEADINIKNLLTYNEGILSKSCVSFKNITMEKMCSPSDECAHCSNVSQMKTSRAIELDQQKCLHVSQKGEYASSQDKHFFHEQDQLQTGDYGSKQILEKKDVVPLGRCWSLHKIKASLVSSVLFNPVAVMLIIAGGLSTPGGNMYLPVLSLENGLSSDEVPWMLTIAGVADILGKLGIGYFADLGYLRPIRIVCMTQFSAGMICQFTMFYKGFGPMAAMSTVFGMTYGIVQALLAPMVIEMVGLPYLAQITSLFFLTMGISTFILNVSVGAIRDATSSFIGGFNFAGGMFLTSFVLLLLEPVFVKCRDRSADRFKNSHTKSARKNNVVI